MLKFKFTWLFACTFSFLVAQEITIDEILFREGDQIQVVFTDQIVNEGNEGLDQVWDFSNLMGLDTIHWRGLLPTDAPFGSHLWPESELSA